MNRSDEQQRLIAIRNLLRREVKADIERLCDAVMESITKSVFEEIDAAFERVANTKGESDESK